jgi:hypothetical protein
VKDRTPLGLLFPPFAAGQVCPEATGIVTWTLVDGQNSVVTKPDGRVMTTLGTGDLQVTSGATGKSVVLKIAGMVSMSPPGPDTLTEHISGHTIWGFFPNDVGPDGQQSFGRSYYMVGTQTALLGLPDYTGLAFSYSGKILMDVCAAISN